tara:strand:- start:10937 stop:12106 length:1170 start_codon:yes stop_codon:yes gene_type:complete
MKINNMKPIYLDYQSTTPVDEVVIKKMLPYFTNLFGNPHSINHVFGKKAKEAIEESRKLTANTIGANFNEIIFTSGATESNNLAIKGSYLYRSNKEKRKKIIIAKTEHKCVIEASNALRNYGAEVKFINVTKEGLIDLDHLESIISEEVALVSIMMANNEIGVLQPLKEISNICKKFNVWLHSDAAQAVANLIVNVEDLGVDLLSISGHKVYGPKGIGALYVRRKPRIRLISQIDGGGQERLIRSGTLPTPLVVGLGEALKLISSNIDFYNKHNIAMRDLLYSQLLKLVSGINLNGPRIGKHRLCNNLNFTVKGINASKLVEILGNKVAFSTGSACSTGGIEPSYVLKSIGLSSEESMSSFRISVGRYTNENEVKLAASIISKKINDIR